jgi:hypothetical protein
MVKTYLRDGGGGPNRSAETSKDQESNVIPWGEAETEGFRPGDLSSPNPTADSAGVDERTFCTHEWTASQEQ